MVKQLTKVAVVGLIGLGLMLSAQPAMAQTIAYIRNDGASDYATHDANIIAALGATGITVNGTAIPGLGYTVVEYQHGTEPEPGTWPAPAPDLIFISQTVSSGTPHNHTTETIPLVNTEAALNDDGGTNCDMYFSDGQSGRGNAFNYTVVDNSHPITQIFPQGFPIPMISGGQQGVMTGDLAAAITPLTVRSDATGEVSLAVAETGAVGFRPGIAADADPAPERRVCLGLHIGTMVDPTIPGVYLLQRTVQWAIGDPVTAGVPVGVGSVTRDLGGMDATPASYTPSAAYSYDLVLTAAGSDSFQTTDTVPAAFAISSVSATTGTATFSGQEVRWSGTSFPDGESRCTVNLTAPAAGSHQWPTDSPFDVGASGPGIITSTVKYGARWDDAPEGYWANEAGVPPTLATTGAPFLEADFENCATPGGTSYIDKGPAGLSPEDVWIMRGTGNQFWSSGDDYHMTYILARGDFDIRARWKMHPPPPYQETRVGMIARNIDLFNDNPALHGGVIWNKDNYGPAQIRRPNDGDGIGRSDRPNNLIRPDGDIYMRLVRQGTETRLYWNTFPSTSTAMTEPTGAYVTDVALNPVVALGFGGSAGEEDDGGQGYFEAEYTSVTAPVYTLYVKPVGPSRSLSVTEGTPGAQITVTMNLNYQADATTLTVVENVPMGHGAFVTNVSHGGVVNGDMITWTLAPYNNSVGDLTYDLVTKHQAYLPYRWMGAYWEDGDGYGEFIPDTTLPQGGVIALFQEGVFPDASYDGCQDNHIIENTPASNQGIWDHIEEGDWRGTTDGDGLDDHKKILVKFDLSSVAPATAIDRAVLGLYFDAQRRGSIDPADYEPHNLAGWPVLRDWIEGTGDGSDGPDALTSESCWTSPAVGVESWEFPGAMGDTDVGPAEPSTYWDAQLNQWVELDVTASAQSMIATAGAADDLGWKVSQDKLYDVADNTPGNEYVRGAYDAASSQNGDPYRRPVLALLDNTAYAPSIGTATRSFGTADYTWGQPLTVTLTVTNTGTVPGLTIREPLPDGMTAAEISNISGGGSVQGNEIVWDVAPFNADAVVTYDVTVPASYIEVAFMPLSFGEGYAEDSAGVYMPIAPSVIQHQGVYTFQDGIWPDASYDGCQDASIIVYHSDANIGGGNRVEEGTWDGGLGDHKKILIQFDLSSIPTTEVIVDARLLMYCSNERRGGIVKGDHFLTPWTILKAWNQGAGPYADGDLARGLNGALADEVSWNNANVGADTGTTVPWQIPGAMGVNDVGTSEPSIFLDVVNDAVDQNIGVLLSFDVTDSVANMVANPAINHGWKISQDKLVGVPDDTAGNEYVQGAYAFVASEAGGAEASLRPMLVVRTDAAVPVDVRRFILW